MQKSTFLRCKTAFFALTLALMLIPQMALAQVWAYSEFKVDAELKPDASVTVKETLSGDFSSVQNHGIIRKIPVNYKDGLGQNFNLRFSVISVTDESGKSWWYEQNYEGEYVALKIGDPDNYLTGQKSFVINYKIERAVISKDNTDEFYWNVTGTENQDPIKNASYTLVMPSNIPADQIKTICFTGTYGSSEQNCETSVQGNIVTGKANRELASMEGLTVSVQFPAGFIVRPSALQQVMWFIADNWGYLLPVITFAILFYLWYNRGRDPRTGRETIMPIYTPPDNLTPGEVGTIIDERVDMKDITSGIIGLAIKGYLRITEKNEKVLFINTKDYEFEKLKEFNGDASLKKHEIDLMNGIFGSGTTKKLSELKNHFYKDLPKIKTDIYDEVVKAGYFPVSPETVRGAYYGVAGILAFGIIFFGGIITAFLSISTALGIFLSGVIIGIFARFMPAKNKKGVEAKWKILGLEEYIKTAEKDRIKFQEQENIFEKLLPYAMALGIADKWTKAFDGIYKNPPDWYRSTDPNFSSSFNTLYLLNSLNAMTATTASTFQSSPRSSGGGAWSGGSGFGGGGFSGGGFGGGGSSRW